MTSKIEWTDETWNPVTGCNDDIISSGCTNCYARRMATRLKGRFGYPADDPFRVTFHPDRLDEPLHWKKPRHIFVSSMGDLFHGFVPLNTVHEIWDIMKACPQHTFIVLTKRPERMREAVEMIYSKERLGWAMGFWEHVWLGVTAENQARADERIPILLQIPAAVRFVSYEPALGPLDISQYTRKYKEVATPDGFGYIKQAGIDGLIAGCESGPGRRHAETRWFRDIKNQCVSAEVPFFLKQIGCIIGDKMGPITKMPMLDGQRWDQLPG